MYKLSCSVYCTGSSFIYQNTQSGGCSVSCVGGCLRRNSDFRGGSRSGDQGMPSLCDCTFSAVHVLHSSLYRDALVLLYGAAESLEQAEDNFCYPDNVAGAYHRIIHKSGYREGISFYSLETCTARTINARTDTVNWLASSPQRYPCIPKCGMIKNTLPIRMISPQALMRKVDVVLP